MVCTIVKTKTTTTRANAQMAYTDIEDLSGTMELQVFPKTFERCREALRENSVVVVSGRVSIREDETARLAANEIIPIEHYSAPRVQRTPVSQPAQPQRPRPAQVRELWLKLPSQKSREFEKVKNLLGIFEGSLPVAMYFEDVQQRMWAPRRLWALDHPLLYSELERILGEGHVATR